MKPRATYPTFCWISTLAKSNQQPEKISSLNSYYQAFSVVKMEPNTSTSYEYSSFPNYFVENGYLTGPLYLRQISTTAPPAPATGVKVRLPLFYLLHNSTRALLLAPQISLEIRSESLWYASSNIYRPSPGACTTARSVKRSASCRSLPLILATS
jgi:hypothetical protein